MVQHTILRRSRFIKQDVGCYLIARRRKRQYRNFNSISCIIKRQFALHTAEYILAKYCFKQNGRKVDEHENVTHLCTCTRTSLVLNSISENSSGSHFLDRQNLKDLPSRAERRMYPCRQNIKLITSIYSKTCFTMGYCQSDRKLYDSVVTSICKYLLKGMEP